MDKKPLIGVICDLRVIEPHGFHVVGDKYVRALVAATDAIPVLIPALGDDLPQAELLERLDGLLLSGAYSNIQPNLYGRASEDQQSMRDPHRDSTSLPLISAALERDIPIFGVCRGFQEINVALGGTLHQRVQTLPGFRDHREDTSLPLDQQYADVHGVNLVEGGLLHRAAGKPRVMVNSLHQQGVDDLAPSLVVEAMVDDGLIEAYRHQNDHNFLLAVQWHPEWQVMQNPFNRSLFELFAREVRLRM